MKANDLNREELLKENKRLMKNLSVRVKKIEGLGLETIPQYASNKFRELQETLPKSIDEFDDEKLLTLNRDLRYINDLETAWVKGAKRADETFTQIGKSLNSLSKEKRDEFFSVYGKLYKTYEYFRRYKYEIFETTNVAQQSGEDLEKLVDEILKEFDENIYEKYKGSKDEERNINISFTSLLQDLREKYK